MENTIEHFPKEYLEMIYKAARNCYGQRDACDTEEKMGKLATYLIKHGHESVLEHVCISIYSKDVSRSFLAQLTRHRLVSYSVKSQHYTKHSDFKYKELEDYGDVNPKMACTEYGHIMADIAYVYDQLIGLGIPHYIAREVLPNACLTDMYITTNVREWRFIINLRITKNNTPEIRKWAKQILILFHEAMPELFEDLIEKHDVRYGDGY